MAAFPVAVLDVVVDEAEVVPELDRCRARKCLAVITGDRGVCQEPEQRADPLATVRTRAIERQVVADHLVQTVGRRIAVLDQPDDLAFGIGDELGEVQVGERRGHRRQCTRNVFAGGSLLAGPWWGPGPAVAVGKPWRWASRGGGPVGPPWGGTRWRQARWARR